MKKIAFVLAVGLVFGLSSCKKCSTCSFEDPVQGTLTNEEVCGKSKQYQSVLDTYKKSGWKCQDK